MNRNKPATGEIYHVYNRGVEKRKIFLDDKDRLRFIHDIFEFNDTEPVLNLGYHIKKSIEVRPQYIKRGPRKLLAEVLAFCLMPNHFHLLLKQKVEGGISLFMKKLGAGYTGYFNQKYERAGSLFQGVYKHVLVKNEAHFIHLPYYIHLNPLDISNPEWRSKDKKINVEKAMELLNKYRWSSHLDYAGIKNFPSLTQRGFLMAFFNSPQNYSKEIRQWLTNPSFEEMENILIEK